MLPQALTHCQQAVLSAVNSQFGTNLNGGDILPSSNPLPAGGGEVNVNFGVNSDLSPAQFNAIHPGRYAPPGILGFITGYGLHRFGLSIGKHHLHPRERLHDL